MLAKRICLQHFWFFGQHGNESQNESQSRLRLKLESFSEYILWRQQWTATAAEQRPDIATAALSSCSSVKFPNVYRLLTILGALPVTTSESERVFSKLQRTLTVLLYDPFYHDGGSTRGASLATMPPRALSYNRHTTCLAHLLREPDDSVLFCSQNCWSL